MADHSWLVSAMRDIREYAISNELAYLVPIVHAACVEVERSFGGVDSNKPLPPPTPAQLDDRLASILENVMGSRAPSSRSTGSLRRLSGRRVSKAG